MESLWSTKTNVNKPLNQSEIKANGAKTALSKNKTGVVFTYNLLQKRR